MIQNEAIENETFTQYVMILDKEMIENQYCGIETPYSI